MDRIDLHPVVHGYAGFLYALLAERDPVASISHRKMPTWAQHVAFVRSDPYAAWYIIGPGMGAIYLTRQDEIGVHLRRDRREQGIGRKAVEALMRLHPRPRYLANIAPGNTGSHRFFERLGFSCIQHTLELRSCPSK